MFTRPVMRRCTPLPILFTATAPRRPSSSARCVLTKHIIMFIYYVRCPYLHIGRYTPRSQPLASPVFFRLLMSSAALLAPRCLRTEARRRRIHARTCTCLTPPRLAPIPRAPFLFGTQTVPSVRARVRGAARYPATSAPLPDSPSPSLCLFLFVHKQSPQYARAYALLSVILPPQHLCPARSQPPFAFSYFCT